VGKIPSTEGKLPYVNLASVEVKFTEGILPSIEGKLPSVNLPFTERKLPSI